ncbi:MAG: hypothetical protein K0Q90_4013, partial [Paenibacillaceae bacterium]|nr:hypothetical protein [Paenibacillaceae bacterium]
EQEAAKLSPTAAAEQGAAKPSPTAEAEQGAAKPSPTAEAEQGAAKPSPTAEAADLAAVTAQAKARSLLQRVAANPPQADAPDLAAEAIPQQGEAEAAPRQKAAGHKRQRQQETGGIFPPVFLPCSQ